MLRRVNQRLPLDEAIQALRRDPTHPVLARVGSASLITEWEKARHEIPMGSLNKVVSEDELRAWVARCDEILAKDAQGAAGDGGGQPADTAVASVADDLFVAEKLDGISIEVIYKGGKLVDAITRGDGEWGERITAKLTHAPGNGAPIGGLKVVAGSGWFAARPSGTEDIYKIYAESFKGPEHLAAIQTEARAIVSAALRAAGV